MFFEHLWKKESNDCLESAQVSQGQIMKNLSCVCIIILVSKCLSKAFDKMLYNIFAQWVFFLGGANCKAMGSNWDTAGISQEQLLH